MVCCLWWFVFWCVFFFKQNTAYEMRISDWSSDVCSSDLRKKKRHTSPSAPEPVAAEAGDQQGQQPDGGVEQGRTVAALHQLLHALTGDGRLDRKIVV